MVDHVVFVQYHKVCLIISQATFEVHLLDTFEVQAVSAYYSYLFIYKSSYMKVHMVFMAYQGEKKFFQSVLFAAVLVCIHCQFTLIAKILIANCPIARILIAKSTIAQILIAKSNIAQLLIAETLIAKIQIA